MTDQNSEFLSFYEGCAVATIVCWLFSLFACAIFSPRTVIAAAMLLWPIPLAAAALTGHLGATLFYRHPEVALRRRIRRAKRQRDLITLQSRAEYEEQKTEEAFTKYIQGGLS